jgi:hypothetical protein
MSQADDSTRATRQGEDATRTVDRVHREKPAGSTGTEPHAPTSDALRTAIDSGAGSDKTAGADPAAAPLGTDDEAGGTSPTQAQVSESLRHEVRPVAEPDRDRGSRRVLTLSAVALVVVVLLLLLLFR